METNLQKCHRQMAEMYAKNKTLKQSEVDLNDLSRIVTKMGPDRFKEQACNETVSKAFEIALEKMETDGDKEVLKGLRQMV